MEKHTESTGEKIEKIEKEMEGPHFWDDKERAQEKIRELNVLKEKQKGALRYDTLSSVLTLYAGAGGDDAEDFVRMLYEMFVKYGEKRGWESNTLHEHQNETGGYKNISFEIRGKGAYGTLKNEAGVHRLVRISPFSAKKLRHTSFVMVEVIPKFSQKDTEVEVRDDDIEIQFARSSGPGGQNVNKRETAVRITHTPTGISAHASTGRTQAENRERALEILKGKLFRLEQEKQKKKEQALMIGNTTPAEWGSQIRSYVLHPYKMVKDHRTNVEVGDVDAVLQEGELSEFIKAEQKL
ncbi:MAG: PCRF domain-containing protein [Candidatus Paceibacterota bacterium]